MGIEIQMKIKYLVMVMGFGESIISVWKYNGIRIITDIVYLGQKVTLNENDALI